jgi:hypothetical protein
VDKNRDISNSRGIWTKIGMSQQQQRDVDKNRDVSNSRGMWTKIGMSATAEGYGQK